MFGNLDTLQFFHKQDWIDLFDHALSVKHIITDGLNLLHTNCYTRHQKVVSIY